MALIDRGLAKRADGKAFDTSDAEKFDYSAFYNDMTDAEKLQVPKDEFSWFTKYSQPQRTADVVLNLSCGVQTVPHVMLMMVAVFRALDVDFVATAGRQFCCGRIYNRFGNAELGDRMAAAAIQRFASWQPSTNVQCCGSCQIEFLYHTQKMELETGSAPFPVIHVTDFILDTLKRR